MIVLTLSENKSSIVTATCAISDAVGDIVYISGNKVGNDYTVSKADLTQSKPAVGIITNKISTVRCVVQFKGIVDGIYSGLTPGKIQWVGDDALPTENLPTPPIGISYYNHTIGKSLSSDILELTPSATLVYLPG